MGSPETEHDRSDDEGPQTQVTISHEFWMGKFELTQGEYKAVTGVNNSMFSGDDSQPVEQVSWHDASNYCALRTMQEQNAVTLPAGYFYRLPTEAEWEYATRAGSTTQFFYGDDRDYTQLPNYAWFDADSNGSTHDVGQKQGNQWGLHDTSGNVFEWCSDRYGPYPGGSVTDPQGSGDNPNRVMRGGSWRFAGGDARSAARNFNLPEFASYGIGIRVVLSQSP
jgi:formylglycine-generating enzyme required for sulfatase activity